MLRFVARRLLLAIPTLLGIAVVTFALIHLAPGGPVDGGPNAPRLSAEAAAAQRRLYFLDLPVLYNPRPRGRAARVDRLVAGLATAQGGRAAERCGTVCLRSFAALETSAARAVVRGIRRDHPRALPELGPSASDEVWTKEMLARTTPEVLTAAAAALGGDPTAVGRFAALGSAALPVAIEIVLNAGPGPRRRAAADVVSDVTGIEGRLEPARGTSASVEDPDATLGQWREWWRQHRRDYVELDAWARAHGRLTETRFAKWVVRLATFSFGRSLHDQRLVSVKLGETLPITLLLGFLALIVGYAVAIPLGIYGAVRRGSVAERATTVVTFVLYALPSFFVAMLLILLFGGVGYLDWFPIYGLSSAGLEGATGAAWLADRAHHLVLPVICMSYGTVAIVSRYQRGAMLDVLGQDFIRAARARGISERAVVLRHGFRNALLPIITLFGLHVPALIGGSVIIERIFNIPGMGLLTFDAFLQRDYPVIMAVTVVSAVLTLAGLLLADVLYAFADPRITLDRDAGRVPTEDGA